MSRGYLRKFIKYMKDVYEIEKGLNELRDSRIRPIYSTASVMLPVLFSFLLRVESFNALKY